MNKIETKIGIINKAKGSSMYKSTNTTVICTIDFNNKHEQMKIEEYDKTLIDVKYRNINNKSYDDYFSHIIKEVLTDCILNIDTCKSVLINLIVDSKMNNNLWCAINAMFLGLVECGIPLHRLLYASTAFSDNEDIFLYNKQGELVWYHAFCNIEDLDMGRIFKYYEYVKEIQDFTYKSNLVIKNI